MALFFIPESPRWLILQGRYEDGHKSLKWLRPSGSDIDKEVSDIREALDREREITSGIGFWDMFNNPVDRRRSFLSIGAVCVQAASGSMFIIGTAALSPLAPQDILANESPPTTAYKAYFFAMAKVSDPFAMSNVLSMAGLIAIMANAFIVVRWGRRRVFLLNGLLIAGCFQLIIAVTYHYNPGSPSTGKVLVALSCLYMVAYNVSIPIRPSSTARSSLS